MQPDQATILVRDTPGHEQLLATAVARHSVPPVPQLTGRQLAFARVSWWVLALLSLAFFISGLREHFSELTLLWFTDAATPPSVVADGLAHLGVSPRLYAGYGLGLYVVRLAAFFLIGGLIFWRKPTERMALLVACFLVTLSVGDVDPAVLQAMATREPVRATIGTLVELVAFTLLLWLFLLFPDGRFQPGWTRALAACWLLVGASSLFLPGSPLDLQAWPAPLFAGFVPACVTLAIVAQVWRYRRISGLVERQQTKWFAVGLVILLVDFSVGNELTSYRSFTWVAASPTRVVLADLLLYTEHNLAFLVFPLALGIAACGIACRISMSSSTARWSTSA